MTETLFNDKVLHLCVLGTRDARFTLLLAALMTFPSTNLVRDPMGSPLSVNPANAAQYSPCTRSPTEVLYRLLTGAVVGQPRLHLPAVGGQLPTNRLTPRAFKTALVPFSPTTSSIASNRVPRAALACPLAFPHLLPTLEATANWRWTLSTRNILQPSRNLR